MVDVNDDAKGGFRRIEVLTGPGRRRSFPRKWNRTLMIIWPAAPPLTVVGALLYTRMPVDLFPDVALEALDDAGAASANLRRTAERVDEQAVGSVVQDWTGVPVGRMVKNEIETVLKLAETLNQRVIGQRHGLEVIARRIQTSYKGLKWGLERGSHSF